jgi:hypothetical protein
MNIQETQHYVQVNDEERQVEITWDVLPCKTTSYFGDGIVTERWTETNPILATEILPSGKEGEIYHFVDKERSAFAKAVTKAVCNGDIYYD